MATTRYRLIGILTLAVALTLIWLTKATFEQDFAGTKRLTLVSDRAGLMMEEGSGVEMRGVNIGRVRSVASTPAGVELELAIEPESFHLIPANVTARIIPPTAFGPKYVSLVPPSEPHGPIAEGAVVTNEHVTVEVNQAFSELMQTLDAAQPALVNSALTATAETLEGRGERFGELVSATDAYLRKLNTLEPVLSEDIQKAEDVLKVYDRATPDLLRVIENATVTLDTIRDERDGVEDLLSELGDSADTSRAFLSENEQRIARTLKMLRPTTELLADYSPMISCTLKGLAYFNKQGLPALGGNQPGVATSTRLFPSLNPYRTPENLPKVAADNGPNCHGLPVVSPDRIFGDPRMVTDTNANPWETAPTTTLPGLSNTLFGVLAGLPGL